MGFRARAGTALVGAALALSGCAWIAPADAPRTGGLVPNSISRNVWLSPNGRFVFFDSNATDLVPETEGVAPGPGTGGIYRRDHRTGTTAIVHSGAQLTRDPGISSDLTRMVIVDAGNYIVVEHDGSGEAELLAINQDRSPVPGITLAATLSAGGRYAAFRQSRPDGIRTYVRDLGTGVTRLVATVAPEPDNPYAGSFSDTLSLTGDGTVLTQGSCAASNDDPGVPDCTRHSLEIVDVATGTMTRPFPEQVLPFNGRISEDGRIVVYHDGQNVVASTRTTGAREVVSVGADGQPSQGSDPGVSADGRYVAFTSLAHIVPELDPSFGHRFVYVRDLARDVTTLVSADAGGRPLLQWNTQAAISADGRYVTFSHHDVIGPREPQTEWRLLTRAALVPRVHGVAPPSAPPASMLRVTVSGYGFGPDAVIAIHRNSVALPLTRAVITETAIEVTVEVPTDASPGAYDVSVFGPGAFQFEAGAGATCRGCFRVTG